MGVVRCCRSVAVFALPSGVWPPFTVAVFDKRVVFPCISVPVGGRLLQVVNATTRVRLYYSPPGGLFPIPARRSCTRKNTRSAEKKTQHAFRQRRDQVHLRQSQKRVEPVEGTYRLHAARRPVAVANRFVFEKESPFRRCVCVSPTPNLIPECVWHCIYEEKPPPSLCVGFFSSRKQQSPYHCVHGPRIIIARRRRNPFSDTGKSIPRLT